MLILQQVSYYHPNRDLLFQDVSFTIRPGEKIGLIGNNGTGKSTLLQLVAQQLLPTSGTLSVTVVPCYVPQLSGQFDQLTVAQALNVDRPLSALAHILGGSTRLEDFEVLNDDWTIEERCKEALVRWGLSHVDLFQPIGSLSGGEKVKVFLAGITIHQPRLVLLDEPTNHLDSASREQLFNEITNSEAAMLIVSHDRNLLNRLKVIYELNASGIKVYGGNYDFYQAQKQLEREALKQDIDESEKTLRKAKAKERESIERQQKLDARGKGKQEKAGVAKIMMNTLRNKAENSTARISATHNEKIAGITTQLKELRLAMPLIDTFKLNLAPPALHRRKRLFLGEGISLDFGHGPIWKDKLDLEIRSGDRIALQGKNGAGKTSLIRLLLGDLAPTTGNLWRAEAEALYIDQDYTMVAVDSTVYELAERFNSGHLQEHEIKIRLTRFLFDKQSWDRSCRLLSGGEKMRLLLCCLTMLDRPIDLLILDEPTNNLDISNVELLTTAIKEYQGTLIVVSHDARFVEEVGITRHIELG